MYFYHKSIIREIFHFKNTVQNQITVSYLSICPNGASTVCEELRHVIIANKLPQTGFQIQIAIEA